MAKIKEVINKLQKLERKYGNKEFTIYQSFDEKTTEIDVDNIYYDEDEKDIYIAIHN